MLYLLLLSISIFLFLGFLALTLVEVRTGARILRGPRSSLDRQVARVAYIFEHVRWSDFFWHLIQSFVARVAHDIAEGTLFAVRFVERELTRIVRYLRDRRPNVLAPKPSRISPWMQTRVYLAKMIRFSKKNPKD